MFEEKKIPGKKNIIDKITLMKFFYKILQNFIKTSNRLICNLICPAL
jgi:hypothetical protein